MSRWRELAITGQRSFVDLTLWGTRVTLNFRSEFASLKCPLSLYTKL